MGYDYSEPILKATDLLINKKIESIAFDQTVEATVIDDSQASDGIYTVSTGNASFIAYSTETGYKKDDGIMVTIPQGDYNKQKIIIGKQVKDKFDTPMVYKTPFEQLINLSGNLISKPTEIGFYANGGDEYGWDTNIENFLNSQSYKQKNNGLIWDSDEDVTSDMFASNIINATKIGLSAQFSTWLNEYNTIEGNYGLAMIITFTNKDSGVTFDEIVIFDSTEFLGDIYNFETYYTQENVYEIPEDYIDYPITRIRLYAYQRNNFKNINNNDIYTPGAQHWSNELGFSSISPNIFIKDCFICLGVENTEFTTDTAKLVTESGTTYLKHWDDILNDETTPKRRVQDPFYIFLRKKYLPYSKYRFIIDLYNFLKDKNNNDKQLDIKPDYNIQENSIIENELLTIDNKKTKTKEEILNLLFENATINRFISNKKEVSLQWIHKEDNSIALVQKDNIPANYEIRWYKYSLGAPSPDVFLDANWVRFYGQKQKNVNNETSYYDITDDEEDIATNSITVSFYPNVNKSKEMLRAIVLKKEYDIQEGAFVDEEYYNSAYRLITKTSPLEFTNSDEVRNETTIIDSNSLSIKFTDEEKGQYFLYNRAQQIYNQESNQIRELTAVFDRNEKNVELKEKLKDYSFIEWTFPAKDTMIIPYIKVDDSYTQVKTLCDENKEYQSGSITIKLEEENYVLTGANEDLINVYYTIAENLDYNKGRNVIYLKVNKDGQDFFAQTQMRFGTAGTSGSDYTITIEDWSEPNGAFNVANSDENYSMSGTVKISKYGQEIDNFNGISFNYSWYKVKSNNSIEETVTKEKEKLYYPVLNKQQALSFYKNNSNLIADYYFDFEDEDEAKKEHYYYDFELKKFAKYSGDSEQYNNIYRQREENEEKSKIKFLPFNKVSKKISQLKADIYYDYQEYIQGYTDDGSRYLQPVDLQPVNLNGVKLKGVSNGVNLNGLTVNDLYYETEIYYPYEQIDKYCAYIGEENNDEKDNDKLFLKFIFSNNNIIYYIRKSLLEELKKLNINNVLKIYYKQEKPQENDDLSNYCCMTTIKNNEDEKFKICIMTSYTDTSVEENIYKIYSEPAEDCSIGINLNNGFIICLEKNEEPVQLDSLYLNKLQTDLDELQTYVLKKRYLDFSFDDNNLKDKDLLYCYDRLNDESLPADFYTSEFQEEKIDKSNLNQLAYRKKVNNSTSAYYSDDYQVKKMNGINCYIKAKGHQKSTEKGIYEFENNSTIEDEELLCFSTSVLLKNPFIDVLDETQYYIAKDVVFQPIEQDSEGNVIFNYLYGAKAFIKYNDIFILDPWDQYYSDETYYYPVNFQEKNYTQASLEVIANTSANNVFEIKKKITDDLSEESIIDDLYILQIEAKNIENYPEGLIARFPIPLKNNDKFIGIEGPTEIRYTTAGEIDLNKTSYLIKDNQNEYITGTWKLIYENDENNNENSFWPTLNNNNILTPPGLYFEENSFYGVQFIDDDDNKWTQPIYVYQDNYPSTTLNKWNGKDIITDNNTGIISAKGFSAGKKEDDNTFTGVIIGDWSKDDATLTITKQTGIYGFNHGIMSYALKDDGTAFFGKDGMGRIYFDGNNARIYSSGWNGTFLEEQADGNNKYLQRREGMMLDVDDGKFLIQKRYQYFDKQNEEFTDLRKISIDNTGLIISRIAYETDKEIKVFELSLKNKDLYGLNFNYALRTPDYSYERRTGTEINLGNSTITSFNNSLGEAKKRYFRLYAGGENSGGSGGGTFLGYKIGIDCGKDKILRIGNRVLHTASSVRDEFSVNTNGDIICHKVDIYNGSQHYYFDETGRIKCNNINCNNINCNSIDCNSINGKTLVFEDGGVVKWE